MLSWSKNSRRLLTGSGDCNVVIWNVVTGIKVAHLRFESVITNARMSPRSDDVCIVSSQLSDAIEINIETLDRQVIPICDLSVPSPQSASASSSTPQNSGDNQEEKTLSTEMKEVESESKDWKEEGAQENAPKNCSSSNAVSSSTSVPSQVEMDSEITGATNTNGENNETLQGEEEGGRTKTQEGQSTLEAKEWKEEGRKQGERATNNTMRAEQVEKVLVEENQYSPVAAYSLDGLTLYVGDSRGYVTIVDTVTKKIMHYFKVSGSSTPLGIKGLVVSNNAKWLLVNSSDRYLRLFTLPGCELHKELQDPVNRQQWKTMIFSPDSEHVLAGAAHRHEHKFYFFDVWSGRMFRNLEGPKEGILDLVWHPTQPILVSVSSTGSMYVWGAHSDESWSSFTPGFTELEQNEEYIEREDEFDAIDDDLLVAQLPGAPLKKKPKLVENIDDEREGDLTRDQKREREHRSSSSLSSELDTVDVVTVEPTIDEVDAFSTELASINATYALRPPLPNGPNGVFSSSSPNPEPPLMGLATTVIPDKFMRSVGSKS